MAKAKSKTTKKKPRTAAQKAATARMLAARKAASKPAKKKPAKKKTKRAAPAAAAVASKKAKRKSAKPKTTKKVSTMKKRKPQRAKRMMAGVVDTLKGGAVGAGAGLGLDLAMGYAPLPASLKTGAGGVAIRAVGSMLIGMGVEKMTKKHQLGRDAAVGALAITLRDAGRSVIVAKMPSLKLGELADLSEAFGESYDGRVIEGLAELIDEQELSEIADLSESWEGEVDGLGENWDGSVDGLSGDLATIYENE